VNPRKTQRLTIELLGRHEGCGGKVFLICDEESGSRHCSICYERGPTVMLEVEAPKRTPLPARSGIIESSSPSRT
jgi:hypothetical protein